MASLDRADPVILGHILKGHQELHALLRNTRDAAAAPSGHPSNDGQAGGCERITRALTALRQHMAEHFLQEEAGGFLEESLARLPRLAEEARRVLAEHPGLLAEADRLIERTSRGDIQPKGWATLRQDVDHFTMRLLDHERRENKVVQQGYNEDLGLVDE
jgi:hypothetical protein